MPDAIPEDIEAIALAAFWDACAVNHDTEHITQAVRSATRAVLIHLGGVGVCGEEGPRRVVGGGGDKAFCELLAGHLGRWHEAANGDGLPPLRWVVRPGLQPWWAERNRTPWREESEHD